VPGCGQVAGTVAGLAGGQGAFEQGSGALEVALVQRNDGQLGQALGDVIVGPQAGLVNRNGPFAQAALRSA
jgi:hypothetical protein